MSGRPQPRATSDHCLLGQALTVPGLGCPLSSPPARLFKGAVGRPSCWVGWPPGAPAWVRGTGAHVQQDRRLCKRWLWGKQVSLAPVGTCRGGGSCRPPLTVCLSPGLCILQWGFLVPAQTPPGPGSPRSHAWCLPDLVAVPPPAGRQASLGFGPKVRAAPAGFATSRCPSLRRQLCHRPHAGWLRPWGPAPSWSWRPDVQRPGRGRAELALQAPGGPSCPPPLLEAPTSLSLWPPHSGLCLSCCGPSHPRDCPALTPVRQWAAPA